MSISSIGSSPSVASTAPTSATQISPTSAPRNLRSALAHATKEQRDQFKGDLANLFSAVKSGDMTAAQTALQAVNTDRAGLYSPASTGQGATTQPVPTNARQADFQALVDAVGKGDAQGAQDALAKLQAERGGAGVQGHRHGHHHHHHGGSAPAVAAGSDTGTDTATSPTAAPAASAPTDADGDNDGH